MPINYARKHKISFSKYYTPDEMFFVQIIPRGMNIHNNDRRVISKVGLQQGRIAFQV